MIPKDIDIAQAAKLRPIHELATERLGIAADQLELYGNYKAKLSFPCLKQLSTRSLGTLILVTAMSPTPAGEGKTTTTVGLGDALNRIGKKAIVCLREPSLGPVFGMKGGAAGGGYAQVVPMEDINLHFTGDFGAIALANNLLAAAIDNHVHHGNALDIDVRTVNWRRVVDMNDRALRQITVGLGGVANGFPREDGFDIVVASEVMAILCLATSIADLKRRLGSIVTGSTRSKKLVRACDLNVHGAMAVLLKDAFKPNLVQTLENNPAILHGGPFANIAHGCNSVLATSTALRLADYVVTEAGFGADLGAEKFIDIKCRKSGLRPQAAVLVATVRAIKFHGGIDVPDLAREDLGALKRGMANLERHLDTIQEHYKLPCVVALNHFTSDTAAEIALVESIVTQRGVPMTVAKHWAEGGRGAEDLAQKVIASCADNDESDPTFVYSDGDSLWAKACAVAQKVYGAEGISASGRAKSQLDTLQSGGFGHLPICVAKTQYSFTTDPSVRGAPSGHTLNIREVRLAAGAEFVVLVCGDIMTMPGLPKTPSAERMDLTDDGRVIGLSW